MKNMTFATVGDLTLTQLPTFSDPNGNLTVVEFKKNIPFMILRAFIVTANKGQLRGQHAHKECQQFLVCTSGQIAVTCDDGMHTRRFVLDTPERGLLIPAGIWAQQLYQTDGAVLTVLCDKSYDEADYLRNYSQFKIYRDIT